MRSATFACTLLFFAACDRAAPPPPPAPAAETNAAVQFDTTRAWLARALACGDRDFLRADIATQRTRLAHIPGVTCEANAGGAPPLRCTVAPPLRIGHADIGWFVIGAPRFDLVPIVLPAPQDTLRNAMSAGAGALSPGTDLGDTTVQCALTDEALMPGGIAGTVLREGDPAAAVRVCAFELAEGVPTCTQTEPGERAYRIETLTRGDYLVYAIPEDAPDARVGYTDCDLRETDGPCEHQLKVVVVHAGRVTDSIDPADLRTLDEAADWPSPPPME